MSMPHYQVDSRGDVTGDVYCDECAERAHGCEPAAFYPETDVPEHCAECEILLDTSLTPWGERYVRKAGAGTRFATREEALAAAPGMFVYQWTRRSRLPGPEGIAYVCDGIWEDVHAIQ